MRLLDWAVAQIQALRQRTSNLQESVDNLIVDTGVGSRIVQAFSSTSTITIVHNKGMIPSSVRVVVQLPASPDLRHEWFAQTIENDINTTSISLASNQTGEAILEF